MDRCAPLCVCWPIPDFGGERARGWGHAESPEFIEGSLPGMILPEQSGAPAAVSEAETSPVAETIATEPARGYWLLSLFSPAAEDSVDWNRGNYCVVARSGRVESPVRSGDSKKVAEHDRRRLGARGGESRARRGPRCRARRLRAPGLPGRIRAGDSDSRAGGLMKYRLTCLTPVLVGDGGRLSAIDYMVWKDQVNVLDQKRIFKLLSKGPRLDGYLAQLKKATKLDFASWGGFAQNFADRRIPFEHAAYSAYWNRASATVSTFQLLCPALPDPMFPAPR